VKVWTRFDRLHVDLDRHVESGRVQVRESMEGRECGEVERYEDAKERGLEFLLVEKGFLVRRLCGFSEGASRCSFV
jgi:hypothetical protein